MKRTKKIPAPSWVYLIAEDLETYSDPNKDTLLRIWQQTDPNAISEIEFSLSKGKLNQFAIKNIDWSNEKQNQFLYYYSENVGKNKLCRTHWKDPNEKTAFNSRCSKLQKMFSINIDNVQGFTLPNGHFQETVKLLTNELEIKNLVDKLSRSVANNDGTIAVTQIYSLIQSIMKIKHPNESEIGGNKPIHEKVVKSLSLLNPVDKTKVEAKQIAEIGLAYSNFVGKISYLRNKHSLAHGTYEFDEDVFSSGFVKSLALFAIGFYFLHFDG